MGTVFCRFVAPARFLMMHHMPSRVKSRALRARGMSGKVLGWGFGPTSRLRTLWGKKKKDLQTSNEKQPKGFLQDWMHAVLRHSDMKWATRDVFFPPLHSQNVISPLLDNVCDTVLLVSHMLHGDLFTGGGGPMDSDQQHVGAWGRRRLLLIR